MKEHCRKNRISFAMFATRYHHLQLPLSLLLLLGAAIFLIAPEMSYAQAGWETLYKNDFQTGDLADWQLDPGWSLAQQNSNQYLQATGQSWATFTKGAKWTDYAFKLRVKLVQQMANVNVRLNDTGRYFLTVHENGLSLGKQLWPNTFSDLTYTGFSIAKNKWHNLSVTVAGNRITVAMDGVERIDYTDDDNPLLNGTIALEGAKPEQASDTDQDALVFFDDIRVVGKLPPPQLSYFYVQHRVCQDGTDLNRLYFQIKYGSNNYVKKDLLTSVKLLDPDNIALPLSEPKFNADDISIYASYNASSGQWISDGVIQGESGYSCEIKTSQLKEGTYKLIAIYEGSKSEYTYTFNKLIKLPIIQQSSIKSTLDNRGNLFCTWSVPKSLFYLTDKNRSIAFSARAIIEVFQNDQNIGYIQTTIPVHMSQVFFPADIINMIKTIGGTRYRFAVYLRTNDNNNRTYSNYLDIDL